MKQHPAISGVDGLPYHEALRKESHFFSGVMGADAVQTRKMYRSFFPTVMRKWWAEIVMGVEKVGPFLLSVISGAVSCVVKGNNFYMYQSVRCSCVVSP